MKLLLDQNLSRKLIKEIETIYPGSCHLTAILPENSSDRDIWIYAQENGFAIVTKDDDFEQRSILLGHPPKVIWLRLGNCKSEAVAVGVKDEPACHLLLCEKSEELLMIGLRVKDVLRSFPRVITCYNPPSTSTRIFLAIALT